MTWAEAIEIHPPLAWLDDQIDAETRACMFQFSADGFFKRIKPQQGLGA